MLKFAIVGNIASGKSTVEAEISAHGYKVFDTDKLCHDILYKSRMELLKTFEGFDILDNGEISRLKIGAIVFKNKEYKQKLEDVIYPKLKQKIDKIFKENISEKVVFISIPLLFEVGWQDMFDKILFVQTDDDIRLERLMNRNSFTKEQAQARIEAQMSQDEKLKKADFIICNNETREFLQKQIEQFIIQLEEME